MSEFVKQHKKITAAFIIPINNEGQLLLTQRDEPSNPKADRKWQFAGGVIEFGEDPKDAAIREGQEELGVTGEIIFPYPIVESHTWRNDNKSNDYHIILINYIVTIGDQTPQPNEETGDWKWYALEEIRRLDTLPGVKGVAEQVGKMIEQENLLSLL